MIGINKIAKLTDFICILVSKFYSLHFEKEKVIVASKPAKDKGNVFLFFWSE